MKTNLRFRDFFAAGLLGRTKCILPLGALALALCSMAFLGAGRPAGFVAHEWGTFTSVQGGDGTLLGWRPLETSRLPGFVYNWQHPGLNRVGLGPLLLGKGGMVTLQRMETPVIYFYANHAQKVDVSVSFPQGMLTEWYPQTEQIGPATVPPPPLVSQLDQYAHQVGVKPSFTFASLLHNPTLKDSAAHWARVEVVPAGESRQLAAGLPTDRSGSHYFAARETDANCIRVASLVATNPAPEVEKFLFYRGVGNFATPLGVRVDAANTVTLSNTGAEALEHLFLLGVEGRAGKFVYLERLAPGEERTVTLDVTERAAPLDKVSHDLGERVARSLVKMGLYRREAAAMVKTWKDSWFAEEGVRVLYVLPRAWTERTLPLGLEPPPRELVRVMVGRAEILTPVFEQKLTAALIRAKAGGAEERAQAMAALKSRGRFVQPALLLAMRGQEEQLGQVAWPLLQEAMTPPEPGRAFE